MNRPTKACRQIAILCGLLLGTFSGMPTADAGKPNCHHCGCQKHVKPVLQLVRVQTEVEIPQYACELQESFYPDKGSICYHDYRCDTFCEFHRTCGCDSTSCDDGLLCDDQLLCDAGPICDPFHNGAPASIVPLTCTCHTKSGCQTLHGAKTTGTHKTCSLRQLTGKKTVVTSEMKWQTVHVCTSCSGKPKH